MKSIIGKLGNMRKSVDWIIYPQDLKSPFDRIVQSDTRIAKINIETGKGVLSKNCPSGAYFVHLEYDTIPFVCPKEFLNELQKI
jgi:hypothetical protein